MLTQYRYVDFAMNRVRMLIHFGVTPYLVFDGDYLPSKKGTEVERSGRRKEARKLGLELLKLGKTAQAHQELQKAVDVTPEMARMLIEELKRSNIQYVVAPYEADSQLAYLEREGIIDAILSEDSDLLVFGAKCLLTKLDRYGECIMIRRQDFAACREASLVGWSDAEFRRMAILSGCDYLASMDKMGLKTAYRLIRKHKTIEKVLRSLQFDGKFKVPEGYLNDFMQAELTFLYPWVFCPRSERLVHLTPRPEDRLVEDMPFIGRFVAADIALGVARGDLHPHTKEPIVVSRGDNRSFGSRFSSGRAVVAQENLSQKKDGPIDSFFKPRRVPLAELDPNSFQPTKSQQTLLEEQPSTWTARPAPQHQSVVSTTASSPRPPRRSLSETLQRSNSTNSTPHPAKRQRLCSDVVTDTSSRELDKPETATSRFFSTSTPAKGEDRRASKNRRKSQKDEFNLWSDDSIEDALAELDNKGDKALKTKKKLRVFADEPQSTSSNRAEDQPADETEESQISILSNSTVDSQITAGTITPASSFADSPAASFDTSAFSNRSQSLAFASMSEKFAYSESTPSVSRAWASHLKVESAAFHTRQKPKASATPAPSRGKKSSFSPLGLAKRATSPIRKSKPLNFGQSSLSKKTLLGVDDSANSMPILENQVSLSAPAQRKEPTADADLCSDIDDSVWAKHESAIVVPHNHVQSEKGNSKGSEDFLVPASEDDISESEGEQPNSRPNGFGALNLGRFAFVGER